MPPTDDERSAFRQRLGLALGESRQALTRLTQQEVADELSVDRDTVGRWERGEREPKSFDLHWLAAIYGVDGDLFLNPPDSITELHARIGRIRLAALEAGAVAAAEELARPVEGAGAAQPGRGRGRRPPQSRQ